MDSQRGFRLYYILVATTRRFSFLIKTLSWATLQVIKMNQSKRPLFSSFLKQIRQDRLPIGDHNLLRQRISIQLIRIKIKRL